MNPRHMTLTAAMLLRKPHGHTHFWSCDEAGHSRTPEEEWERWDLLALTPDVNTTYLIRWPPHIYAALNEWQIIGGFDASTADWVQ
ncbi:hypothetical protein WG66_012730 [Moniliophthora roreri]|nr:hypothetical protein WG66_012730 [Moniliophthora roreri]